MREKYSRVDTIGSLMRGYTQPTRKQGFLEKLIDLFAKPSEPDPWVALHIRATDLDFARAESFLDDLEELTGIQVTTSQLIAILYHDFVTQLRKSNNLLDIYKSLIELRKVFSLTPSILELSEKSPNHLALQERKIQLKGAKILQLEVPMYEKYVRRGEFFLMELRQFDADASFKMTVEELISLQFRNMIEHVRRGKHNEFIQDIVNNLSKYS